MMGEVQRVFRNPNSIYELGDALMTVCEPCQMCGHHTIIAHFKVNIDLSENSAESNEGMMGYGKFGCEECGTYIGFMFDPHMTAEQGKRFVEDMLIRQWKGLLSQNSDIHDWMQSRVYDVANGSKPKTFREYISDVRYGRIKEELKKLKHEMR